MPDAASYYARRSARDPDWRQAQLAAAAEREARRRQSDPERVRELDRLAARRTRRRQTARGLTFAQLLAAIGGDRATLVAVLNSERAAGRVRYAASSRRYELVPQAFEAGAVAAFAALSPPEPNGRPSGGDGPGPLAPRSELFLEAINAAEDRGEIPEGDYLYADVIVAMSEQAQSLPSSVFDGLRDSRWEFDPETGAYVRVRPQGTTSAGRSSPR